MTRTRHDPRRELYGQGIGNLASGLVGGLAGAGATVRTLVNVNAGGKTKRSGMFHSIIILFIVIFFREPAGWIPLSALAGILVVTAFGIFDEYSLSLVWKRRVRGEFLIVVVVTAVTVAVDLMIAVAVGVAIAAIHFLVQQSRAGVLRRRLRGDQVFSRRQRQPEEVDVLREHGAGTVAYPLSGTLFFGTADALLSQIAAEGAATTRVILDFHRMRDIDLTGVQILRQVIDDLRATGKTVALSGLDPVESSSPGLHAMLVDLAVFDKVGADRVYPSLDRALEAFEDEILAEHPPARPSERVDELDLGDLLVDLRLAPGEVLFARGTPAECVVFAREGRLARITRASFGESRILVIGAGEAYGARVLTVNGTWRSDLRAEGPARVSLLPRAVIERLWSERPESYEHLLHILLRASVARIDMLETEIVLLEES